MAMSPHEHRERIEEQASLWAARLRGRAMTDRDRAELAAWLEADPEHRWVLSRYRELSGQLDAQLGTAAESLAVLAAAGRGRRWRMASATLGAAAAAVLAIVVWTNRPHDFATKTAERHGATLADGSRIELNAQTSLAVDFRRDERRVRLTGGEAWFSVAKDAERPFVIETPTGSVRVTGTVFNVRAAGARVEVTVLEGAVRLRAAKERANEAVVRPGQQATMGADHVRVQALPDGMAQDVVAWRLGQVVFEDATVNEVIEHFAAYQAHRVVADPAVAEMRLGGRYHLDDLEGLLRAIERVLPVRIVREAKGDIRIVARPSAGE